MQFLTPTLSTFSIIEPNKEKVTEAVVVALTNKNDTNKLIELNFKKTKKIITINILSNESQTRGLDDLKKILDEGGTKVALACNEGDIQWKTCAIFTFSLLQLLQAYTVQLAILCQRETVTTQLIHGASLSLQLESPKFQHRLFFLENNEGLSLANYFDLCFSSPNQVYYQNNNMLKTLDWKAAPLYNSNKSIEGNTIIIGGSGGIGQALAKHLSHNHNCQVFILGRRPLSQPLATKLKESGAKAYLQTDICNLNQARDVFNHIQKKYGQINHILHLAGKTKDCLFRNKTKEDFISVIRPKVAGLQTLEKLAEEFKPNTITLFSSLSGVVGNIGQTDYAAANACFNLALNYNKPQSTTTWKVAHWGLWHTEEGMQMESNNLLKPMPTEAALEYFDRFFLNCESNSAAIYNGKPDLVTKQKTPIINSATNNINPTPQNIKAELIETLTKIIIKCAKFREIDKNQSLLELGIDSIIATNISIHIQKLFEKNHPEISISKTLLFQYSTIEEIASFLIEKYSQDINALFDNATEPEAKPLDEESGCLAIIGMAGEFPGADNIEEFWNLLKTGKSAIQVIPKSRWAWESQFHPNKNHAGTSYCRHGGFINQAKEFDNEHFKIPPRDAEKLDPQVRRLLHQSYYALEQCDFLSELDGDVGVFTAAMYNHYQNLEAREPIDSSFSALSNHISYFYNFQGPSLCVDTMCSGGLTALHVASNSLLLGECKAAIVAAVNIMPHPGKYSFLSSQQFLSRNGKCSSFGAAADGYVPGEGITALVIKPLAEAKKSNNKIFGIIRGSSINSAGKSSRFTVPSASAQAKTIKKALKISRITPNQISHIETHGTGTELGDPIEIDGLSHVFSDINNKITISTVKSNIGHLEAAAGLAGVIKTLLQMHFQEKVSSINCNIENPILDLENTPFELIKSNKEWKNSDSPVFAGVSAFGAGGSNAHVILQSPPLENRYKKIPISNHSFNSKPFWANIVGKHNEVSRVENRPFNQAIEKASFYVNSKLSIQPPIEQRLNASNLLTLVTEAQSKMLDFPETHIIVYQDHSDVFLTKTLNVHANKSIELINLTALDQAIDSKQNYKIQFNIAKALSSIKVKTLHIYIEPGNKSTLETVHKQACHSLFQTLSIENNYIDAISINTTLEPNKLLELFYKNHISTENNYKRYHLAGSNWSYYDNIEIAQNELESSSTLLRKNGTYIVTGGLGEIGFIICKKLLSDFKANVICIGRSTLKGKKLEAFNMLKQIHSSVRYYEADVTSSESIEKLIETTAHEFGSINGVIHSACVLKDKLINEKSWHDFDEVLKCKVEGAINLDRATENLNLDFFMLFSSMSSVFGNVGQTDYCTANAFLDLFSEYREQLTKENKRTGRSISINWPLWDVETVDLDSATKEFICETLEIESLQKDEGATIFSYLTSNHNYTSIMPLIKKKQKYPKKKSPQTKISAPSNKNETLQRVVDIISSITKIEKSKLHADTNINEIGMTSILLTEIALKIEQEFTISIAPSVFFMHNTIAKIFDYITKKSDFKSSDIKTQDAQVSQKQSITTSGDPEKYAIIGIDCLLPGGPSPDEFWEFLLENKSAVDKITRWQQHNYLGACISNISHFDNTFFKLSNREAELMDPQHRLFLQVAYNALLNAGYIPNKLDKVGVFVGVQFNDYQALTKQFNQSAHPYAATGNAHAMLANRVSYTFDFSGPSETLDTACSSTFVAINRGILSLKNNDCDLVLAGATSLLIDPSVTAAAESMGILSPNSRSATFDANADGYVRGEGVGAFVIKRLKDALQDKDPIHAIILDSAENHGGRANSLTAPNPIAQKNLLKKAYRSDQAKKVSYIETHGTGTKLGDPIEIDALKQAFHEMLPSKENNSILLGAVKTNVGHLEPAAGVPSLIKTIYALKNGMIPANINFTQLNPYIDLSNCPFALAEKNTTWQCSHPKVAGISCFGFGGSNTHIVLTEPPSNPPINLTENNKAYPIVLSAQSRTSLNKMKEQLALFLQKKPNTSLESLSYTLCTAREHFQHKFAFMAENISQLKQVLKSEETPAITNTDLVSLLKDEANDWNVFYSPTPVKIHIPGYVFDTKSFWINSDTKTNEVATNVI